LPYPPRVIGHRLAPGEFRLAQITAEQAPIPAYRSFQVALPRLVEGFDQIDAIVLRPCPRHHLLKDMSLAGRRWTRAVAHPSCAGPPHLPDQDFLAGKGRGDTAADFVHMGSGDIGRDRKILPIRENVDGDEIDRRGELAVAQPELPDI